ncbi:phosphodiester glycosidase family protein [Nocardioides sp. W7]|uniref:phosphodiester glycosidase family protein n=1 Tax=Nocardioides sp. W7 TaxID=2931390 RepID=UPI001FD0CF4C|nr:phosphodiester glycosidase family protein [Nocardioides sp. W7]
MAIFTTGIAASVAMAPFANAADTAGAPIVVEGMNLDRGGTAVINDLSTEQVAPGLTHVEWERLGPDGWQQINVLKAELSDSTVKMKYLTPPTVAGRGSTVTELTESSAAVAGVNLDRFDINNSGAAAGWGVRDGKIIKSGNPDASASVGMTKDGLGALVNLALVGSARFADDTAVQITGINVSSAPTNGLSVYNSQWGEFSRARALSGPAAGVEVVLDAQGKVTSVSDTVGEGQLAEGVQALVAADGSAAANRLKQLATGDRVTISYSVDDANLNVAEAGGAWHPLVRDGVALPFDASQEYFSGVNPRTMIGFSSDRRTAYFVVVDGRVAVAKGMGFTEMGRLMLDLGIDDAINADGGGSSQMNIRRVGDTSTTIANSPSDGFERHDGDGMGLVLAAPGSGELEGYAVAPASDTENADRVFAGFHRTMVGRGHDETGSPVDQAPASWSSSDTDVARVGDGVVAGRKTGTVKVRARRGVAMGVSTVQVLGAPTALTVNHNVVNLEKEGASETLSFTGRDALGFTALVEAGDLTVDNPSPDVFKVEPTADGRFTVTAIGDTGTATLRFSHGDLVAEVAVAVPLEVRLIDDFSDISQWTTAQDRAPTGSIGAGDGHDGQPSIKLNYDFTQSTGTRGRYAVAPGAVTGGSGGIDIPGRPQKLSVWVKGDGNGSLLRLQVMQANGVRNWLDGADENGAPTSLYATWTGWERKDFVVPSSFSFPLKLERIRILETVAAKQYTGSMEFSKIYAYLPPDGVTAPVVEPVQDPLVTSTGGTDQSPLRVAVMSDAQFVARDPNSGAVAGARDALREIVAEKPDVLIINGDFVDEASPADFDLARSILDEELGGVGFPWYYVPGNHEVMGGAITNFKDEFGATNHTFDLNHTRLITLNTTTGKLADDFSQVRALRTQFDDAAEDPRITGVLVFEHHPIDDPLPTKGSQLGDRNEAELLEDWLTEFRADTGKSIGFVGSHVGVFHADRIDGVPHLVNGNSGKGPASTPEDGGFTGWTMLGIDPEEGQWEATDDRGADWLSSEVNARVDSLTVQSPGTALGVGQVFDTAPVVLQDDTREVPVAWPVSHAWSGTDGVFVGEVADAPSDAVAAIDPTSGELSALRPGSGSVTLKVNDAVQTVSFTVTGGEFALSGSPVFGQELTATLGGWAVGGDVSHQWLRDGLTIPGATAASYRITAADIGHTMAVEATVTGADRAPVTVRAASTTVRSAVQAAPTVQVSGEATIGSTLLIDAGSWQEGTTVTFAWLRDGHQILGARSSGYRLTEADRGARIQAVVTGHLEGYESTSATSAASSVVTAPVTTPEPEPVPTVVGSATPGIAGTVRVGLTLQARTDGWESGSVFTHQWLRDGSPILGATGAQYVATAADRGHRLTLRVIGAKVGRVAVSRDSAATGAVAAGRITVGKPRLKGIAKRGAVLKVLPGDWGGAKVTYTWYRGTKVIRSATSNRYKLGKADVGSRIKVVVRATKAGYESARSAPLRSKRVRR